MADPGLLLAGLPNWERIVFAFPYYNVQARETPADPMAAGSNLHPVITAGGVDVTAAVEAGTYTGRPLAWTKPDERHHRDRSTHATATRAKHFIPLKFNLINASTGAIEDVMVIDPSSIITCSADGYSQQQALTTGPNGPERLNFEAFNRLQPNDLSDCM